MHRIHTAHASSETEGRVIQWAAGYDMMTQLLTFGKARAIREKTADLAQIESGDVVLDVGCGTGELTRRAIARAGTSGEVHGIDPAPEMIAVARRKAARAGTDARFQVGVIEALPFPDHSFDVVLSSLMMHHLPDDLKQQGLFEIYRVLKPGGTVTIVDFKRPTSFFTRVLITVLLHGSMAAGVQDLSPLLEKAGFTRLVDGNVGFRPLASVQAHKLAAS